MSAALYEITFYEQNVRSMPRRSGAVRAKYHKGNYTRPICGVYWGDVPIADAFTDALTEAQAEPALDLLLDLTRARFAGELP